jgi:C_GCAxxG_C_C family probable redox protein
MTQNSRDRWAADLAFRLGYEYEASFGACSQCTALAIMDTLGTRNPDLFKAAFGFAGGIADLSKTCGALAGGVLMIGSVHGRPLEYLEGQSEASRRRCLEMVRQLHDRFVDRFGSIECAEVHRQLFGRTFNQWDPADFEEFLRLGGHVDKCTAVVGEVARWTVEILSSPGDHGSDNVWPPASATGRMSGGGDQDG